jgi:diguanylate cyclase (GGDEF)-like protein
MCVSRCDVDHFKKFNDSFGHVIGDQVLRLIESALKLAVRGQDTPARFGGEEFAVILLDTPLRQAPAVAEDFRWAIIVKKIVKRSTGESLGRLTISIGIQSPAPTHSRHTARAAAMFTGPRKRPTNPNDRSPSRIPISGSRKGSLGKAFVPHAHAP